jgi:hypothetical protein
MEITKTTIAQTTSVSISPKHSTVHFSSTEPNEAIETDYRKTLKSIMEKPQIKRRSKKGERSLSFLDNSSVAFPNIQQQSK